MIVSQVRPAAKLLLGFAVMLIVLVVDNNVSAQAKSNGCTVVERKDPARRIY